MAYGQNRLSGAGVGDIWIRRRCGVAHHLNVTAKVRVVDEELAVVRVVGVEGHAQQALLPSERHQARDVKKRCGQQRAAANHANPSWLLDDKQPARVSGWLRQVERGGEAARDQL